MKIYLLFLLLAFPILIYGQTSYKIKKDANRVILLNHTGTVVDTLENIASSGNIRCFHLHERLFMINEIYSGNAISFIIQEFYVHQEKFVQKRSVSLNTRGCLASKDLKSFKIKVRKGRIVWKFRRKGKKHKGAFSLEEYGKLKSLELPKNVCNKNPYSGY